MKRIILYFSIVISLFLSSCKNNENPVTDNNSNEPIEEGVQRGFIENEVPNSPKAWTFMLYDDADFTDSFDPLNSFSSRMYSTANINVLVLQDTVGADAKLWFINEGGELVLLKNLGEINMGSAETLSNFIEFGKYVYPSERTIVSFYNHGSGWDGACTDVTDHDMLSMDDMCTAITENGGIDLIFFSAPCLMGSVESMYELRDCVDIYLGSENTSGYLLWLYPMESIRELLQTHPTISNDQLGISVVQFIEEDLSMWGNFDLTDITMSAVKTNRMQEVKNLFADIADNLYNDQYHFKVTMDAVKDTLTNFYDYNLDLHHLLEAIKSNCDDANLCSKIIELQEIIETSVLAEVHGEAFPHAKGIAIYFPSADRFSERYRDVNQNLDWTSQTLWDELIYNYLSGEKHLFKNTTIIPEHLYEGQLMNF